MSDDFARDELEKTINLVSHLVQESQAGRVTWAEDPEAPAGADGFHTFLAGKEVFVMSNHGDGRQPFTFMILESGNALQKLDTAKEVPAAPPGWTTTIAELYREARLHGRTVNKALDEIMAELQRNAGSDDIPF
jgi:hypothetical protein